MSMPVTSCTTYEDPAFAARAIPANAREWYWSAPDGASLRRIEWAPSHCAAQGPRGSLMFVPGRGDAYEKWLESLHEWSAQGWNVASFDWRGQALSGRYGTDALTGHIDDFAIWIKDFTAIWTEWVSRTPGPHVLVGHSMGGHLTLRAVAERRVRPDALVLSAPMLGLHPARVPTRVLLPVAKLIARLGDPRRAGWKHSEKPQMAKLERAGLLTHDTRRYADEAWWREQRPGLAMGAASWRWIERALTSIRGLERSGVLEAVDLPVLIVAAQVDGLVSWPAIARAAQRLPNATLCAFGPESRHEILREVDAVRDRAMARITQFFDRVVPVSDIEG